MTQIFTKIFKVINSCETMTQLEVALNYLKIAEKNGFIKPEFMTAIYLSIYIEKYEELNTN